VTEVSKKHPGLNLDTYDKDMLIKSYKTNPHEEFILKEQEKQQGTDNIEKLFGNNNVCSSCLGIFQILDNPDFLKIVTDKVIKEGYEFESFKFNNKIPYG